MQHEGSAIAIDDPQSCIICWQQSWCPAGARQANPGSAAHSTMIASMIQAFLVLTCTVYTCTALNMRLARLV